MGTMPVMTLIVITVFSESVGWSEITTRQVEISTRHVRNLRNFGAERGIPDYNPQQSPVFG
jgi:hypothetical protein